MKKYYKVKLKDESIDNIYFNIEETTDAFWQALYGGEDKCDIQELDFTHPSVENINTALHSVEDFMLEFEDKLNELKEEVANTLKTGDKLHKIEDMIRALREILNDISKKMGDAKSNLPIGDKFKEYDSAMSLILDNLSKCVDNLKSQIQPLHDAIEESGIKLLDKKVKDNFVPFWFDDDGDDYWYSEARYQGDNLDVASKMHNEYEGYQDFVDKEFSVPILGGWGNTQEMEELTKYFEQEYPEKAELAHRLFDKKTTKDSYIDMKLAKKLNKNFHIGKINDEDAYVGRIVLVGNGGARQIDNVVFTKTYRGWEPTQKFEEGIGPMYNGTKYNGEKVYDRFETESEYMSYDSKPSKLKKNNRRI